MYLKRLELYGFKTFADRTALEFGPGITAIVGPNGSGKSNLVDALLWALGEQSLKTLRSAKSLEVIFAGSEGRRPLGVAEATLTFDNAEGRLSLDFPEITVTRRFFRAGESEFLINRVPCRLRDIQELFLDTGLGRQTYSIVSQTQIDAVLSLRPEDRRELFEEAAGVQKYRQRRREAQRRLEQAQANLVRVNDIIAELEAQREPLILQSETAKRYMELAETLTGLKLHTLILQHQQLSQSRSARRNATPASSKSWKKHAPACTNCWPKRRSCDSGSSR